MLTLVDLPDGIGHLFCVVSLQTGTEKASNKIRESHNYATYSFSLCFCGFLSHSVTEIVQLRIQICFFNLFPNLMIVRLACFLSGQWEVATGGGQEKEGTESPTLVSGQQEMAKQL